MKQVHHFRTDEHGKKLVVYRNAKRRESKTQMKRHQTDNDIWQNMYHKPEYQPNKQEELDLNDPDYLFPLLNDYNMVDEYDDEEDEQPELLVNQVLPKDIILSQMPMDDEHIIKREAPSPLTPSQTSLMIT